jgi:hypothetical protein
MIEFLDKSGEWQELYGHGCKTVDDAHQYVSLLGRDGRMRVKGEQAPFPLVEAVVPPLLSTEATPEQKALAQQFLKDVLKDMK